MLIALAAIMPASSQTIAPPALKPGDTIAIVSPGSTPRDSVAERAAAVLEQWGFKVKCGEHIYSRHHTYAGTTAERAGDLIAALEDPEVKAIIATRGGYGSSMLLPVIGRERLERANKWVVGYSDITALHSAIVSAGHMSIHGNMCGYLGSHSATDSLSLLLRDVLTGKRPTYTVPAHRYNRPGTATGIVLGGNMAVFSNIAGSKDFDMLDRDNIADKDIILFFEDVGESIPRVASMLTQLKVKGVFSRVRGVVVGRFTDYKPTDGYESMAQMLQEYLAEYPDIPVCYDFCASHDESWNRPMIVGATATLTVTEHGATLMYHY